jgi:hopanoid-associated phosphorylase
VTTATSILVVTGAAFEADIADGAGVATLYSAANPAQLRTSLNNIDPDRFHAVISFGLAGGLDPALRPGDLVTAHSVVAGSRLSNATAALPGAHASSSKHIAIAGADAPVMDPAAKAALRAATDASAVDMESHIVAEFAAGRNLPWGVLRAICDPAERALPAVAMGALKPDGEVDLVATLKSVARDPLQIPALIRTGIDTAIAVRALRRARGLLGLFAGLSRADLR